MKPWILHLGTTKYLVEDTSDEAAQEAAKNIVQHVRASAWVPLAQSRDSLDQLNEVLDGFEDVQTLYEFNLYLDMLYDMADLDRVWLG